MSGQTPPGGADPSMDDILASIRKILNEEDPPAPVQAPAAAPPAREAEPIQLTPEMMIAPPENLAGPSPVPPPPEPAPPVPEPPVAAAPPPPPPAPLVPTRVPTNIMQTLQSSPPELAPAAMLLDPLAAAAAAAALGQLSRAVSQERTAQVTRGGPSIEDVVREEVRPMLKAWLDAHLPATVERLVRAEIERVMARQS
jgi:cell pole-organizing protein PopZ